MRPVFLCAAAFFLTGMLTTIGQSRMPADCKTMTAVTGLHFGALELKHNSDEQIAKELIAPAIVKLVAKSAGISDDALKSMRVYRGSIPSSVYICDTGNATHAFDKLSEKLRAYHRARKGGHTKEFLIAVLKNDPVTNATAELRMVATNLTLVPLSYLILDESGAGTNSTGALYQWGRYRAIDGEIAWEYFVRFNWDRTIINDIDEKKCDAKEYDPKLIKIIDEVESEVTAEMKKSGSYGQFGSVHAFWRLKREKLKSKGISWRSPAELNPNSNYD